MTNDHDHDHVEDTLTTRLEQRAATIAVHPDLRELAARASMVDHRSLTVTDFRSRQAQRAWWLAAAALVFVGLLGVQLLAKVGNDDGLQMSEAANGSRQSDGAVAPDGGAVEREVPSSELIVWLKVGAMPFEVAEVRNWLEQNSSVTQIRYVDALETWQEFRRYFADEPEILDLVEPDQLPTSFLISTSDPTDILAELSALFDVVDEVMPPEAPDERQRNIFSNPFAEEVPAD